MEFLGIDLNMFWFGLLGILLTGYAILDGFDLGVGILHLCVKEDQDRRLLMNSIGPLWDGNVVWLVTFGGGLFAAFPHAYATAFSGFYLPFMLLLFALIFRGVSMEFRSKRDAHGWRQFWDVAFFGASTLATFLFGVAVGNSMLGLPIGSDMEFQGGLADLLRPYSLLVGVFAISLFAMHGSIFLYLKTEGGLQKRIHKWMWRTFFLFLFFYIMTTIATMVMVPTALTNFEKRPLAWVAVILNVLAIANIPRAIHQEHPAYAFFSSACTIAASVFLFGMALFPNLITSTISPETNSLNIYNSASSQATLSLMRWIAFLGMPFVMAYTSVIYWVFRGKVQLGKLSY